MHVCIDSVLRICQQFTSFFLLLLYNFPIKIISLFVRKGDKNFPLLPSVGKQLVCMKFIILQCRNFLTVYYIREIFF